MMWRIGVPLLLMALIVGVLVLFPRETTFLFGGSERLVPMVTDYLVYVSPTMLMCVILYVGMFVLRLDGAPNYAMTANIINSVLNIVLDYVFIFPLGMGIKGAAIATSISTTSSAAARKYISTCPSSPSRPYASPCAT